MSCAARKKLVRQRSPLESWYTANCELRCILLCYQLWKESDGPGATSKKKLAPYSLLDHWGHGQKSMLHCRVRPRCGCSKIEVAEIQQLQRWGDFVNNNDKNIVRCVTECEPETSTNPPRTGSHLRVLQLNMHPTEISIFYLKLLWSVHVTGVKLISAQAV